MNTFFFVIFVPFFVFFLFSSNYFFTFTLYLYLTIIITIKFIDYLLIELSFIVQFLCILNYYVMIVILELKFKSIYGHRTAYVFDVASELHGWSSSLLVLMNKDRYVLPMYQTLV